MLLGVWMQDYLFEIQGIKDLAYTSCFLLAKNLYWALEKKCSSQVLGFMKHIFCSFVCHERWTKCISIVSYSINSNGHLFGYMGLSEGWGRVSSYYIFFFICNLYAGTCSFNKKAEIQGIYASRNDPAVSRPAVTHLF